MTNNQITLTIDGKPVTVPDGSTVLDAARQLGVDIPTLCFMAGVKEDRLSDRFSMANPNSAYVTSWLTKQWASVDLSLSQTHLIETPNNQLTVGVSRAIYLIQNKVTVNIGEHLWTDLENRLWSRTTDVSMDYGWKSWDLSLSIEHREDPRVNTQSIWTAVKTKF